MVCSVCAAFVAVTVVLTMILLFRVNTSCPHQKGKLKYGIIVPTIVNEVLQLDKKNSNILWADAMEIEMKNACVAFELLP